MKPKPGLRASPTSLPACLAAWQAAGIDWPECINIESGGGGRSLPPLHPHSRGGLVFFFFWFDPLLIFTEAAGWPRIPIGGPGSLVMLDGVVQHGELRSRFLKMGSLPER